MGMEEELRAKAIASMSVSENHKNNPKTKAIDEDDKLKKGAESSFSPFQQGREEGELSSEDADAGPIEEQGEEAEQNQELPTQVASAASPIASGSNVVTAAPRAKHARSSTIAGKCVPANSLVNRFDAQPLTAILRNHRKHLEMNPVPSRSSNHHKSGWYGPSEADSNLVIRFSDDDDSGSDSDEHKSVRTSGKRDVTLVANMDKRPLASSQIKARTLQWPPASQTELMLKKVSMSRTFVPTRARVHRPSARGRGASSAERESHIQRNASMHKSLTSQEPGGVQGMKSTDNELEILRREIALRESELMSQRKNVPQHKEKVCVSYGDYGTRAETNANKISRPASVSTVELAAGEHEKKRLKSSELSHVSLNSVDQQHVPVPAKQIRSEFKNKVLENLCTKDVSMIATHPTSNKRQREDHEQVLVSSGNLLVGAKQGECSVSFVGASSAASPNVGVPPKQQNNSLFSGGISGSCSQSNKGSSLVDAFNMLNRSSGLVQMMSNADDDAAVQPACSPEMPPKNSGSQRSKQAGTVEGFHLSSLLQSKETSQHNLVNSNEPNKVISGNRLLMPRNILDEHSHLDLENMLRTFDASVYNESMLNHLRQLNSEGRSGLDAQTLANIEELQDKELEEAQELRRRCELEELSALKAYRSAQRALIDANERCSYLYQRRELFSSKVQAFIMKNSSSLWPSRWHGETGIDSLRNVSEANVPLRLSCPMQGGRDVLDLEARESNMQHTGDAPLNTSYQQVNRHNIGSEPCSEPDASTSERLNHKDISAVHGVFSPSNNPDASADEDEGVESRLVRAEVVEKLEKREGVMNGEAGRKHYIESSQDSELVEASLRSELFARLGMRMPKNSDLIFNGEHNVETRAQNDVESRETHLTMGKLPALSDQQFVEEEQNEMADTEGTDRPGCHNSFRNHGKSHCKKPGSDFGCHRNNLEESSSSLEESCRPNYDSVFSLPSSVLKIVFRHTKVVLSNRCEGYRAKEENAHRISDADAIDASCHKDQLVISRIDVKDNDIRVGRIGKLESCTSCPVIHPSWPFCMFELRGKCNDDECSWQHARDYTQKNLKQHHDSFSSDGHVSPSSVLQERSDALELVHSLCHYIVPVPTYRIGSKLIKADKHLSRSVLARDLSQYWRRDFCTSFAVPFCILRIAPPDVPSLQASDGFDEDCESRSRLSLYFQSRDGNTKKPAMEGLTASEQSLELALDLYNGAVNEQDGKKQVTSNLGYEALTVLSRSLEVDPSSVVLWIIYLHIYYAKEKAIGKDDMFFLAIQLNEGAYELWLMYINSRMHLGDRLGAYDTALSTLCRLAHAPNRESKYSSACILDLFLQMFDFLRMTGDVEKAILRVRGLLPAVMDFNDSSATLMSDILSCLTISDKCILWICCVYLLIYEKLPEAVVQRFEFEQELPFQLEWPSIQLTSDKRNQAIELMKVALDTLTLCIDDDSHERETALRSVHSLAVNHIQCIAAIEGIDSAKDLLVKYVKQYPTCIELVLTLARCQKDNLVNEGFNGFEEAMCNWPKEVPGIQCIWNQYLEYAMENGSVSLVEKLMLRWFDSTREVPDAENGKVDCGKSGLHSSSDLSTSGNFVSGNCSNAKDELFGLLNLSFYRLFQNDQAEARRLLDKALKLAPAEDLKHFVGTQTLFLLSEGLDPDAVPPRIPSLLLSYLIDSRSFPVSEPLSRKFATSISKPRIRQLINRVLGPVSFDCSLMNSVLKELYGPSLLRENFGKLKDLVDFVEDLMEILPANYQLAMSACKFLAANIGGITSATAMFWASSLLVNSIFQASPAAPEQAWIQVADILGKLEMKSISERFHQQAVSVYPFSVKLWESYINLSKETGNVNAVLDAARERGI